MKMGRGTSTTSGLKSGQVEKTSPQVIPLHGNKNNNRNSPKGQPESNQHGERAIKSPFNQSSERLFKAQTNQTSGRLINSQLNQSSVRLPRFQNNQHGERLLKYQSRQDSGRVVEGDVKHQGKRLIQARSNHHTERLVKTELAQQCEVPIQVEGIQHSKGPVHAQSNYHTEKLVQSQLNQKSERLIQSEINQKCESLVQTQLSHHDEILIPTQQGQHSVQSTQSQLNQKNKRLILSEPSHPSEDTIRYKAGQSNGKHIQPHATQYYECSNDISKVQYGEQLVQSKLNKGSDNIADQIQFNQNNEHLIQSPPNEQSERTDHPKCSNEEVVQLQSSQHGKLQSECEIGQHRETPAPDSHNKDMPSNMETKVLHSLNENDCDPHEIESIDNPIYPEYSPSVRNCKKNHAVTSHHESITSRVTTGSKKDIFQFWSAREENHKMLNANIMSTNPNIIRNTGKSLCKKEIPGQNTDEDDLRNVCNKHIRGRKKRTEMFSLSTFTHIDHHVLTMSEQISPADYSIEQIVSMITEKAQSDLQKIRAIWIWLCHNIRYDVEGYLGLSPKIYRPKHVVKTGKAVCSGYAGLFKEMCRQIGIKCVEVSGSCRGSEYIEGLGFHRTKSNHMWNALELDKEWYLLDACWGAGTVNLQERLFIPSYDEFYFFTDPEDFNETHWPDDPAWQLLEPAVSFEVFEQNVFKTSEFFKLRLFIISPKVFYLKTDHGEVQLSLGCPQPMEFSYKIYMLSDNDRSLVDKRHGILTMSSSSVSLRVMPPVEGLYELMIFARPTDSKAIYKWVCSYQVDCPQARCSEGLPKNPFHFWGLHQKVKDFGISGCNHEEDLIVTSSSLDIVFKTSRPLLAMYELAHEQLTGPMSKKCFISHIEETQLSCHLVLPYPGYYRLSLFVKNMNGEHYKNATNLLIQCTNPINHNELFPPELSVHCGPGLSTKLNGLVDPSHPHPLISTTSGVCTITFHTSSATEVHAVLQQSKGRNHLYSLDRYCLVAHLEHKISISLHLPMSGYYKLSIFAKNQEINPEFSHVCDYVIRCLADNHMPPFPKVYSAWRQGCILLQPRAGLLAAESWETFRVKVAGAHKVVVIGPKKTELQVTKNKIWEGSVYTGPPGSLLKLGMKSTQNANTMDILMSFKSQDNFKVVDGTSG